MDAIRADDVTVTLVREAKPEGLFRYFDKYGCHVTTPYHGIYYINGLFPFPTQIVVTGELNWDSHVWLKSLSGKLEKDDIKNLLEHIRQIKGKAEQEYADSVLEVSMRANEQIIKELRGDDSMNQSLLEVMAPILEPIIQQKEEDAMARGMARGMKDGMARGMKMVWPRVSRGRSASCGSSGIRIRRSGPRL